ncbi:hypothetical protein [Paraglaciecola hydrolytica]|uniref:Uncharacterized protein n=1 Tax=Paraglaciecola hydrolytica TaxID=1799789 RepID=A0A136A2Q8_9ALTE|nr:hypothetical protein [Paraglaciecola hydrolytica]KXI29410.1 hypothetical protein AX660_14865 [Paraglaciecola hydrolytica]
MDLKMSENRTKGGLMTENLELIAGEVPEALGVILVSTKGYTITYYGGAFLINNSVDVASLSLGAIAEVNNKINGVTIVNSVKHGRENKIF